MNLVVSFVQQVLDKPLELRPLGLGRPPTSRGSKNSPKLQSNRGIVFVLRWFLEHKTERDTAKASTLFVREQRRA